MSCIPRKWLIALSIALISSQVWAGDLPDPTLTPGVINQAVTQENIHSTICVKRYSKSIRPPASYINKLKKRQVREYSYEDTNPNHYEEDYLIPLSIGGNPRDPGNLWPEPRDSEWNADQKDDLEFVLYRMVCEGEISLKDAQNEIANNWVEAYKKHVLEEGRRHFRGHVD